MQINDTLRFSKTEKPFRSFYSTWITHVMYEHNTATQIIDQLKTIPQITNIQFYKKKYWGVNSISVSFKTEADEAAFILYAGNGIKVTYEKDL